MDDDLKGRTAGNGPIWKFGKSTEVESWEFVPYYVSHKILGPLKSGGVVQFAVKPGEYTNCIESQIPRDALRHDCHDFGNVPTTLQHRVHGRLIQICNL